MSRFPLVSVMIPCYNHEKYILNAISSALSLNYPNLEVIFLDDCSKDNSFEIVKNSKYSSDKRLKIYRNEENLGRTRTYRKLLYELSKGEWAIMLDGDDYFYDNYFLKYSFEKISDFFNSDKIVTIIGGYIKRDVGIEIKNIPPSKMVSGVDLVLKYPDIFYAHGSVIYKRVNAMQIDFYRAGIMSDDLESHLRLFLNGDVLYIDRIFYVWNVNSQSTTVKASYNDYLRNINTLINYVHSYGVLLYPNREKDFRKWKKKAFLKLSNILISVYGFKDKVKPQKIYKDIISNTGLLSFIFSSTFFTFIFYLLLPSELFLKLRNYAQKIRKKMYNFV
jgi:glycosyltransferase involved in cell wall biosynthesis